MKTFNYEEYQTKLRKSKQARSMDRKEMLRLEAKTDLSLSRFSGKLHPNDLPFKSLNEFILGEWYLVNDHVKIRKIDATDDLLVFETIMIEGGKFGWHIHSDCHEVCAVLEGILYNTQTDKIYNQGEQLIVLPNEEHHPVALENTKLLVTFDRV